jgi:YfiH family protein
VVCAVLSADCLPVVLARQDGSAVAVAHCGWRGLAAGVLRATVQRFGAHPAPLRAWLGPAIGPGAFEVGAEVREAFLDVRAAFGERAAIERAFSARAHGSGKFLADLYALARETLRALGVREVTGGDHCTVADAGRFYSYRRDGLTGRMATLAWIDLPQSTTAQPP